MAKQWPKRKKKQAHPTHVSKPDEGLRREEVFHRKSNLNALSLSFRPLHSVEFRHIYAHSQRLATVRTPSGRLFHTHTHFYQHLFESKQLLLSHGLPNAATTTKRKNGPTDADTLVFTTCRYNLHSCTSTSSLPNFFFIVVMVKIVGACRTVYIVLNSNYFRPDEMHLKIDLNVEKMCWSQNRIRKNDKFKKKSNFDRIRINSTKKKQKKRKGN